jgi:gamma-glutamyltranspeptidase / glutathione hydrolase
VAELLSKERGRKMAQRIDMKRAAPAVTPLPVSPKAGQGDTVYLTVVDRDRNVVSLINSIFHAFGSALVAGDTGVLLHNRGSAFSLDEKHPNRLEGRKRPLHTIIPGMLFQDGRPVMSFGVMGGTMQPQGHVQVVLNMLEFGMNIQEAGDAARFRHEPAGVDLESRIPEAVKADLAARGHKLSYSEDMWGGYQAIWIDWKNDVLLGGSDPRKDGMAVGW